MVTRFDLVDTYPLEEKRHESTNSLSDQTLTPPRLPDAIPDLHRPVAFIDLHPADAADGLCDGFELYSPLIVIGVPILLDPTLNDFGSYRNVTMVRPGKIPGHHGIAGPVSKHRDGIFRCEGSKDEAICFQTYCAQMVHKCCLLLVCYSIQDGTIVDNLFSSYSYEF